ncbi:MAG: Tol-Pal system beta propeller repeat protein TolB [candidate division Zixibacteria bacterium]
MKTLLRLTVLSLILSSSASAQWGDVRNIFFDTISAGFQPLPVAVDVMKPTEGYTPSSDDETTMGYVTRILQADLNFYADFDLVLLDSFYMRTYEITELDLLGWKRLGAEYVVTSTATFSGNNLRIDWKLFDSNRQREIASGQAEYNRSFWRELGYNIANEVVRALTGDPGIFRTKIVFVKKIRDAKELFVADYDGANERQLTKSGTINISPSFAPNLEQVYFTSYMEGDPQLFRVDASSGEFTRIGKFPGSVTAPSVSPDGKKIACVLSKDGNHEIYVLDLTGRIIKRVTRSRAIESSPTWSPDGRFIAYSSDRTGAPQIYVSDADGVDTRRLTYQGGYNDSPVWSHRGDRITFVTRTKRGRFDLASIDTSGADYRVLTEVGMNENPHFSPDGKHIIFSSNRLSRGDLFTMDLTGRNQRRLTRNGACTNPSWGPLPR